MVEQLRQELEDPGLIERFRRWREAWQRVRKLGFARVVVLILVGHQRAGQTAINRLFKKIGEVQQVASQGAYSKARQKLKPQVYQHLNQKVWEKLYEEPDPDRLWQGHRLIAADASYFNLPDTPAMRARFSVQVSSPGKRQRVQGQGGILYDLKARVGLASQLSRRQAEKQFLFAAARQVCQAGDVLVLDRLYADSSVWAFCRHYHLHGILRFPRRGFRVVAAFWDSSDSERVVELPVTAPQQRWMERYGLETDPIRVRLVKVPLATGETEVLGTDLLDSQQYPPDSLKQVYGWRWGVETYWDQVKNSLEMERWSGLSPLTVEQDFYSLVFLASLESVLSSAVQAEMDQAAQAGRSAPQQVNHRVSAGELLDEVVGLLLDKRQSAGQVLEQLHALMRTAPVPKRPGRRFPRLKRSLRQVVWYLRYQKRSHL